MQCPIMYRNIHKAGLLAVDCSIRWDHCHGLLSGVEGSKVQNDEALDGQAISPGRP